MKEERENKGAAPFPTHVIQVRDTAENEKFKAHIAALEATVDQLRSLAVKPCDPPPCYEENILKARPSFSVWMSLNVTCLVEIAH